MKIEMILQHYYITWLYMGRCFYIT